jgi:hypothetical protein
MSESLFTKFFDAMQDRVARHDIEAEQLLERNFKKNKFSGKTTFTGIVMSDPGSTGTTQEGMVTANNFKPIKVFIEGIDDAMVDPLEIANSVPSEEQINMFNSVVGGLLTAYPSSELQGTDPTSQIQLGSKVELQFYDQGPQTANHGKMRGLRYIRVLNSSDSRYSAIAGQFEPVAASSFGADGGSIALTGDFSGILNPEILADSPQLAVATQQLIPYLQAAGYQEKIKITSAYRDVNNQVNAMLNNMFGKGASDSAKFKSNAYTWVKDTYRFAGVKTYVKDGVDRGLTKGQFKGGFSDFIKANISSISSHPARRAIDIRTQGTSYASVQLLKLGLEGAKTAGIIRQFKWEYIDGNKWVAQKEARKLSPTNTSPNPEHIHVTFANLEGE